MRVVYSAGGVTATGMASPAAAMPTSKVDEAGRLPSIEMEPKTLTLDQIKYAREAAQYVVNNKSEEEAIQIFTAGLRPLQMNSGTARSSSNKSSSMDSSSDDDVDLGDSNTCGRDHSKGSGAGRRRRGLWQHSIDDIRDIATAPF